jgi:predicted methyltransferase
VKFRFAVTNEFGVPDHDVELPSGTFHIKPATVLEHRHLGGFIMIAKSLSRFAVAALVVSSMVAPISQAADAVPAYIQAAVADASRPAADKDRDVNRKPAESVAFAGVKPGDKVGELMPGGGYFTRILSKTVGSNGVVYAMAPTPAAPAGGAPARPNAIAALAAESGYANIKLAGLDAATKLPEQVDLVWTSLNYHDFARRPDAELAAINKMVFDSLKPGGVYLVIDHASAPGAGKTVVQTLHRIDPEAVKKDITSVGFVVDSESKLLQNPKDPHTVPVHDPAYRGTTDQFILKFRKPK